MEQNTQSAAPQGAPAIPSYDELRGLGAAGQRTLLKERFGVDAEKMKGVVLLKRVVREFKRAGMPVLGTPRKQGVAPRAMPAVQTIRDAGQIDKPDLTVSDGLPRGVVKIVGSHYVEMHGRYQCKCIIEIHPEREMRSYVPLGLNGTWIRVKPGSKVMVPRPYVDGVLRTAVVTAPVQNKDGTRSNVNYDRYGWGFEGLVLVDTDGTVVRRIQPSMEI